jgi:putative ABC transport system permease protein
MSDEPHGPNVLHRRLTTILLAILPARLRDEYGAEMRDLARARLERARRSGGVASTLRVWLSMVGDAAIIRMREAHDRLRRERRRNRHQESSMSLMANDVRYAARRLARTPMFTLGALAIMAIAIGANTAVFTVVNQMLLKPPPYERPDEVVNIYQDSDDGDPSSTSFPAYRDMAALEGVFQFVSATTPTTATLDLDDGPQSVSIEFTTSSFLETIGRQMTRGRWFESAMDVVGAGNYGVVSHRSWTNRFGADPSIVGRTVSINGQPVTVTGVGPEGVNGVGGFVVTDFWLSISSVGIAGPFMVSNLDRREDHWYDVKARLAGGVTVAQAQQAMDALAQSLAEEFPELNAGRGITVFSAHDVRLHPEVDSDLTSVAAILMTVVALLLVRGVARGPEVAVRRAMGAARSRVTSLFLVEALLISVGGGLLGLLLARWLLALLALAPLPGPLAGDLDLSWDPRVLGFSALLMIGTGVFFGLTPALQSLRTDVAGVLREDHHAPIRTRRLSRLRNAMVTTQVAVSLILVVGAGVMVRSLISYQSVDPGVDHEHLAFLQTDFTQAGVSAEERGPVLGELLERFASLPGVGGVALTSRLAVQGGGTTTTVIEDYEPVSGTGSVELNWALVSPDYFETVGITVRDGRGYLPEDVFGDGGIIVVNEAAASTFWRGEDVVGRRIRPQSRPDAWRRVVGVVSDSKVRSLSEAPTPMLYYLMDDSGINAPYFVVRTEQDPAQLLASLRRTLTEVNARLPMTRLATFETHLGEALAVPRFSAGMLGLFSLLALALASLGVYTIVSFSVAGRRREVGIRVALGAERSRVVRMVVGEVAWTVGLGLLAGGAVVVLAASRMQGLLFGSQILSFETFGLAVLILGMAIGFASWIPAWRASSVDPATALRGS